MTERSSLRLALLRRLGALLTVLLVLDAATCYLTAVHFANVVYDRWLIDSVRSLSQAISAEHGQTRLDLSNTALQVFQFDEIDKTYFRVTSASRGFIAGDRALPSFGAAPAGSSHVGDIRFNDVQLRAAASRVRLPDGETVDIVVAETLRKREHLAREILLGMVAPQIALLAIAGMFVWLGVSRGLKPLTDLSRQIERRGQDNLTPILESGLPREARILVARINELLDRIAAVIGAQRRFVADAAHQLRTPLASLLLQIERIQRAPDRERSAEAIEDLRTSVERAAHLSRQLLTLARAEPAVHGPTARLEPLNLAALAREVGEEWAPRAMQFEVDFGLAVPKVPVPIQGDPHLLGALLGNLIDNALRYGGRHGRVTVSVEPGARPQLAVADEGPGIAADQRTRVFERFYRAPDVQSEGCGLGLAIVSEIARLHGAEVALAAGRGERGAVFTVIFPAAA